MTNTVIKYVLDRLYDLGIKDILVLLVITPSLLKTLFANNQQQRWIGNCNELNAAYAADGYARIKGMAALSTTLA